MHFPSHLRAAFAAFVEEWAAGRRIPTVGRYEQDHEEREATVPAFLAMYVGCSDIVPAASRQSVQLITDCDQDGCMTYARAARRLREARQYEFASRAA